MKTVKLSITALLIAVSFISSAQRGGRRIYNWALGMRYEIQGGVSTGATVPASLYGPTFKYLLDPQKNLEIMVLSDYSNGTDFYSMFHFFNPFPDVPQNFRYYFGLGGHVGKWRFKSVSPLYTTKIIPGIDGQLGFELIWRKVPFALSVDWHPMYNLVTYTSTDPKLQLLKVGVTLKYAYKR